MKHVVVTIDGPAGTGKSTVARMVAQRLGYLYLDTGALYRAAALAVDGAGGDIDDNAECGRIVSETTIELKDNRVEVNCTDVTDEIRSSRVSTLSSRIAVHPSVRKILLAVQRAFSDQQSLVVEGRDTGSVVFPDASVKIYLDASATERARRRHEELISKGVAVSFDQVLTDVKNRDQRDTSRQTAPLVVPEHAIVVDTTHLTVAGVVQKVVEVIQEKLADK